MSFVKVSTSKLFLGVVQLVKGRSHATLQAYSLETTACCRDIKSNLIKMEPEKKEGGVWTAERKSSRSMRRRRREKKLLKAHIAFRSYIFNHSHYLYEKASATHYYSA